MIPWLPGVATLYSREGVLTMTTARKLTVLATLVVLPLAFGVAAHSSTTATPQRHDLAAMKAEQAALTPAQELESLRQGNERFASGKPEPHDMLHDRQVTAAGQYPHAIILTCIDSRVPPEIVFDANLGELFCDRVAGNVVDPDLVGSMEYACEEAGSKLVLVMGHTSCGAVKGACDGLKMGNLTGLLQKIEPAIASVQNVPGERNSKNHQFVDAVVEANVRQTMKRIREMSPILRDMEHEGKIQIVGSVYDLETGKVRFLK